MFWADKVAQKLKERNLPLEWVDDMKTPSGRVHVGALIGISVHGLVHQALKDINVPTNYTYVFENHDPMDDIPSYLSRDEYEKYLGMPLYTIPSPVEGFENFAEYYAKEFQKAFNAIGFFPKILWTKDIYTSGKMNPGIKLVLDNAQEIRTIYQEMYKKDIPEDWFPFQVYCENCGKVSTTKVYKWDGEKVFYTCPVDATTWTPGCGHEGSVSPFSDETHFAGKMPWKVEWAAKWQAIGVTVEGAGKDHMSRGGSHDLTSLVAQRVLNYPVPYPIAYEWMLIGGRKMSSSKGVGYAAGDMLEILPPTLLRFLLVKMNIKQQMNFDPSEPETIPKLFDEYQKYAKAYVDKTDEDKARIFELSQIGEVQNPPTIRFSVLAQWVQMPNMQEEIIKQGLEEWAKYARIWVERFAPDSEKFVIQKTLPDSIAALSTEQRTFLGSLGESIKEDVTPEDFQVVLYNLAKEQNLSTKDAFAAVYTALLGKNHGPRAAWLILSLDREFVQTRFKEVMMAATSSVIPAKAGIRIPDRVGNDDKTKRAELEGSREEDSSPSSQNDNKIGAEIFSIAPEVSEKYPSISIGIATIKSVTITKTNPELEKDKEALLASLAELTTEKLGEYPEIQSYRKLYKEMGVDWHSRRPSPEALLRRIALGKGLYTVNTCVDAYNLVVMKHRVSIGAFDLDAIQFPTKLRFPSEGDSILLLGDTEPTNYKPSELAYFDVKGGYNIDFNYRDAQRTAVQESTQNIYVNVDGYEHITPAQVEVVLRDACEAIIQYCGGTIAEFGVITT